MLLSGIHAGFMIIGFFILFFGFLVARYMKRKNWWLKTHRALGVSGALLTMLGFIAIVFDLLSSGRFLFTLRHGYVGIVIVMLAVVMPVLGFIQLKKRKAVVRIRPIHRFLGWIMLMAMFINIIIGMNIVGIL
ncbi:MAG: hypothetical protein NT178_11585 [Proteobacteria bacterium]|nr:hypothetical protein [Pseudomonadota bacterium]